MTHIIFLKIYESAWRATILLLLPLRDEHIVCGAVTHSTYFIMQHYCITLHFLLHTTIKPAEP